MALTCKLLWGKGDLFSCSFLKASGTPPKAGKVEEGMPGLQSWKLVFSNPGPPLSLLSSPVQEVDESNTYLTGWCGDW